MIVNIYQATKYKGKFKPLIVWTELPNCFSETSDVIIRDKQKVTEVKTLSLGSYLIVFRIAVITMNEFVTRGLIQPIRLQEILYICLTFY